MRIDFGSWSLTSREIYLVVVWLAVYMLCGLGMTTCINDHNADADIKYIEALGIEADGEKMKQAMITDAGNALVTGEFEVVDPVFDTNLDGKWLRFTAIYEEEELETHVGVDADGDAYTYHTWEWHEKRRWNKCASRIKCNGIEFGIHAFDYRMVYEEYHVVNFNDGVFFGDKSRIRFYCMRPKFNGAFFTTFNNKRMDVVPIIYPNKNYEELRKELTTHYDVVFGWIFLTIFFFTAAGLFVFVENDWLENLFRTKV